MNSDRYFNGHALPEEMAALESEIIRDAQAANLFAEAARIEAGLAAHFTEKRDAKALLRQLKAAEAKAGMRRQWRPVIAAAAAVVVAVLLAVNFWPKGPGVAAPGISSSPGAAKAIQNKSVVRHLARSVPTVPETQTASEPNTPAAERLRRRLANFYVPEINFERVPLDAALVQLTAMLRDFNHFRRPELDALKLELHPKISANSGRMPLVTLKQKGLTLLAALKVIAAQTGREIDYGDSSLALVPRAPAAADEALATRSFQVRPDFLGGSEQPPVFGDVPYIGKLFQPTIHSRLQDWGLQERAGAKLNFDTAAATITMQDTPENLLLMEAVQDATTAKEAIPVMVNATSKLIEFANGHEIEAQTMGDDSFRLWLRDASKTEGADLLSAPQVTTRSDQRARVEVMRTIAPNPTGDLDWQGLRIEVNPVLEGELVHLTGSAEVRKPSDVRGMGDLTAPVDPNTLVSQSAEIDALVPDGQTAIFSLGDSTEGPQIVTAITIRLIGPDGEALNRPLILDNPVKPVLTR